MNINKKNINKKITNIEYLSPYIKTLTAQMTISELNDESMS